MFNKKILFIGIIVFLSTIIICCLGFTNNSNSDSNVSLCEPILVNDSTDSKKENISYEIFVEVKGAVKKPGVYKLDNNAIINDVITQAGGFKTTAYTNNINLSKKISSEMVIYVFTKTEYKNKTDANNQCDCKDENSMTIVNEPSIVETIISSQENCTSNGYLIDNCTNDNISIIESSDEIISNNSTEDNSNCLVNINTADLNTLMTLPGIGESKANAIIDYRKDNPFKELTELMNVSGISEKTYEKIKEFITI